MGNITELYGSVRYAHSFRTTILVNNDLESGEFFESYSRQVSQICEETSSTSTYAEFYTQTDVRLPSLFVPVDFEAHSWVCLDYRIPSLRPWPPPWPRTFGLSSQELF